MQIVASTDLIRSLIHSYKKAGESVAFVPTMGGLHEGHIRLITAAQQACDRVVASIFVNPLQFGEGEDYENYPSCLDDDQKRLSMAGVDALFTPTASALYLQGLSDCTKVLVPDLSAILCGHSRPGHFSGVATVVCKLLNIVQPDDAYFGEKDYQQLLIIKRMVDDLHIPITVYGVPTVREADGLAMSSRNAYLTSEERRLAPLLYRSLQTMADEIKNGYRAFSSLEKESKDFLNAQGFVCDYVEIRRAQDLFQPSSEDKALRILAAARLGRARLIDNLAVIRQN